MSNSRIVWTLATAVILGVTSVDTVRFERGAYGGSFDGDTEISAT